MDPDIIEIREETKTVKIRTNKILQLGRTMDQGINHIRDGKKDSTFTTTR